MTSDSTFPPGAGQGQWSGCTGAGQTVGRLHAPCPNFRTPAPMFCPRGNQCLFLRFCGVARLLLTGFLFCRLGFGFIFSAKLITSYSSTFFFSFQKIVDIFCWLLFSFPSSPCPYGARRGVLLNVWRLAFGGWGEARALACSSPVSVV